MIKIIVQDIKPDYVATCSCCGTKFSFNKSDTGTACYDDFAGHSFNYQYVNCPKCNYELWKPEWKKYKEGDS